MNCIFENDFVRNFCEHAGINFDNTQRKSNEFTFGEFKKYIDRTIKSLEFDDKVNELAREYWNESGTDVELSFPNQITSVLELLGYILNDKDDWIGYWFFELDCGKNYKPGMVSDKDGTDIPLATIEDLWNLLTKENKNENK